MKPYKSNIEKLTLENDNFRKVEYTAKNCQVVLMSIPPKGEIGEEIHDDTDQFFRFEEGSGKVIVNGEEIMVEDGSAVVVPMGEKHNVINTGDTPLKLYTIYTPPHHKHGTIHKTREEAVADDEHFDGVTS